MSSPIVYTAPDLSLSEFDANRDALKPYYDKAHIYRNDGSDLKFVTKPDWSDVCGMNYPSRDERKLDSVDIDFKSVRHLLEVHTLYGLHTGSGFIPSPLEAIGLVKKAIPSLDQIERLYITTEEHGGSDTVYVQGRSCRRGVTTCYILPKATFIRPERNGATAALKPYYEKVHPYRMKDGKVEFVKKCYWVDSSLRCAYLSRSVDTKLELDAGEKEFVLNQPTEKHLVYGYHTNNGVENFLPDLAEALELVAAKITPVELEKIERLYITTEPYGPLNLRHDYLHRGVTVCYVVRKSAPEVEYIRPSLILPEGEIDKYYEKIRPYKGDKMLQKFGRFQISMAYLVVTSEAKKDDIDTAFFVNKPTEKHVLYGLHTPGMNDFAPDLLEVIKLINTVISVSELDDIDRLYVTSEPAADTKVNSNGMNKGVTTVHVVRKSAPEVEYLRPTIVLSTGDIDKYYEKIHPYKGDKVLKLIERRSISKAYLVVTSEAKQDDVDKVFFANKPTEKHVLHGLHTTGTQGIGRDFAPDLLEVIKLIHTVIPVSELDDIARLYVTSEPAADTKVINGVNKGTTTVHVLRKLQVWITPLSISDAAKSKYYSKLRIVERVNESVVFHKTPALDELCTTVYDDDTSSYAEDELDKRFSITEFPKHVIHGETDNVPDFDDLIAWISTVVPESELDSIERLFVSSEKVKTRGHTSKTIVTVYVARKEEDFVMVKRQRGDTYRSIVEKHILRTEVDAEWLSIMHVDDGSNVSYSALVDLLKHRLDVFKEEFEKVKESKKRHRCD